MDTQKEKYYVGIDIGTNSVGCTVTDENYNIIKINGKKASLVRLMEPAESKKETRVFRSTRRRMQRKKYRLDLLRQLFAEELFKIDPSFLKRLEESFFVEEDKLVEGKYSLFCEENFNDKHFYKKFPTMYHLKKFLMESDEKQDLRFIYLAVHSYLKGRGHFLLEGDIDNIESGIKDIIAKINDFILQKYVDESEQEVEMFDLDCIEQIGQILSNNKLNYYAKMDKLKEVFKISKKYNEKLLRLALGKEVAINEIFILNEYNNISINKINFSKSTYEEEESILASELGDDFEFLANLKEFYNYNLLKSLLNNYKTISDAMIYKYNQHKSDLKVLKKYIKNYQPEDYFLMFKAEEVFDKDKKLGKLENYPAYIGMTKIKKNKYAIKKVKTEAFYNFVKKFIKKDEEKLIEKYIKIMNSVEKSRENILLSTNIGEISRPLNKNEYEILLKEGESEFVNNEFNVNAINIERFEIIRYIFNQIEKKAFLPKQLAVTNSVIPHQLNLNELEIILNNAKKHYSFISENFIEKVVTLFKHRVPYFVGPLHTADDKTNKYSWVVRNSFEKATPFNFNDVINTEKSQEEFINKLINYCTYIHSEKVIPKKSLLFSKYMVLNELNRFKINNDLLNIELKNRIYNEVFKTNKTVSLKTLKDWLLENNIYSKEVIKVSSFEGCQEENKFASNLSSYIDLKNIIGDFVDTNIQDAEDIIEYITVYGANKKMLEKKLKENYPSFSDIQIKKLTALNFKEWSSLSRKFLTGIKGVNKQTGEINSIMEILENTNNNLTMIIYDPAYNFKELLDKENPVKSERLSYDLVEELYCSPMVKRPIWQALKIIEEIVKLKGYKPDKIFIEVTRTNAIEKGRTSSRKQRIINLYKEINDNIVPGLKKELLDELETKSNIELKKDAIYLYFLQQGKCMYTNRRIYLNEISRTCDVDHIYPQWLIKDDSITNKVLVLKNENSEKSSEFPISPTIQANMKDFWFAIKPFIGEEKYNRLTRTTELTADELASFVNRQLVNTNQAINEVIKIVKRFFVEKPEDVVYSKAENVTDFRAEKRLTKIRNINDHHHAKDAYLNIVVGNVLRAEFGNDVKDYIIKNKYKQTEIRKEKKYGYNLVKTFDYDVEENGKKVWSTIAANDSLCATIDIVEKNYYDSDVIVTKANYRTKGMFYNENLCEQAKDLSPIKTGDSRLLNTARYGGYGSKNISSYFVFEYDDKNGKKLRIEPLPVLDDLLIKQGKTTFNKFVEDKLGFKKCNVNVLVKDINPYSVIRINDVNYYIATASNDRIKYVNAEQLNVPQDIIKKLKPVIRYCDLNKLFTGKNDENPYLKMPDELLKGDKISEETLLDIYAFIVNKLSKKPYINITQFKDNVLLLLRNNETKFLLASLEQKCLLINNLFSLLNRNTSGADLRLIGGKEKSGVIMIQKVFKETDKVELVTYSTAGFKRNVRIIQKGIK